MLHMLHIRVYFTLALVACLIVCLFGQSASLFLLDVYARQSIIRGSRVTTAHESASEIERQASGTARSSSLMRN